LGAQFGRYATQRRANHSPAHKKDFARAWIKMAAANNLTPDIRKNSGLPPGPKQSASQQRSNASLDTSQAGLDLPIFAAEQDGGRLRRHLLAPTRNSGELAAGRVPFRRGEGAEQAGKRAPLAAIPGPASARRRRNTVTDQPGLRRRWRPVPGALSAGRPAKDRSTSFGSGGHVR